MDEFRPTHRHKKTGGEYAVICRAVMEATHEPLVVYVGITGTYWVRPAAEFDDGRFEEIDVPW